MSLEPNQQPFLRTQHPPIMPSQTSSFDVRKEDHNAMEDTGNSAIVRGAFSDVFAQCFGTAARSGNRARPSRPDCLSLPLSVLRVWWLLRERWLCEAANPPEGRLGLH